MGVKIEDNFMGGNRVDVRNDAEATDWLRAELGKGRLAGIFRRDNELVHTPRMGEEGYLPPQDLGLLDAGPAQVRPITTAGVKSLIEARYDCWRTTTIQQVGEDGKRESTKVEIAALFPQPSAQSACEAARLGEHTPNLKTLNGVTHTPMMRPDGTILDKPGYDEATGFLYLPDHGLTVPPIPDQPPPDQIKAAVELILTPIKEFPFVSDDDRATWSGLLFTPALRPLFPGPYQMGVITATNPGSGKTKLANMIKTVHGGVQRGEMPREADELRKSITATLMDTTAPVVTFDNMTGVIRSSVLESLLTTTHWTDRWLGHNRSVTATNDRLWLATGNNAAFGGDLARRIVTVRLDPPGANPHLRTNFKIDLETWWPQHRGKLLAELLTIARGWVVAGMPSQTVRSDDYARWVGGLRGMLSWAGFPGTFGGSSSAAVTSSDDEEWRGFLVALHDAFGVKPFTVKELVGQLPDHGIGFGSIDPASLPGDLAEKFSHIREGRDGGFRKSLGWWLKNRLGRYAGGWSLVKAEPDTHAKVERYAVKPSSQDQADDTPEARHAEESGGLRGLAGFPTLTRGKEDSQIGNGAGGQWAGRKAAEPRNPASWQRAHPLPTLRQRQPAQPGPAATRHLRPLLHQSRRRATRDRQQRKRQHPMSVAPIILSRGRTESDRLTLALLNLTSKGQRPHCSDADLSELWLSEYAGDRAEACKLCRGCPVLTPCRDAAEAQQERFGVWGGRDYTRRPRGQQAA